jgi:catechol 2,3-dioxygenase-like lactoylglutathione lyase family enzyme
MILHHVSVGTNDLDRAQAFYEPIMKILGLRRIKRSERLIGAMD